MIGTWLFQRREIFDNYIFDENAMMNDIIFEIIDM